MPKLYEGREIAEMARRKDRSDNEQSFDGKSHFGRYFANSRSTIKQKDQLGYQVIKKYFHLVPVRFHTKFFQHDPPSLYSMNSPVNFHAMRFGYPFKVLVAPDGQ